MVYLDYEPLTKGEREGMRHFVSVAQPGYTTPCYNTVRDTLMPNALSEMEGRLRELLQLGDGFALTLDIWTNRRGHSFLGVVASFVDEVFNGHTVLLSCEHLKGHHTAESISQKYEGVLQHWNLQRRVVRVVTDSASNMIKAFNLPGFEESAVEEEGEEEDPEEAVRKSTLNTEQADKLGVRPTQACITRWSSQLRMIESVIKMFERDSQFQNKLTIPENSKLTINDVLQLQALTEVLSPLAELTNAMQKELGNLGMILPAVMEIKQLLSSLPETLPLPIRAFAETLSVNVSTRFNRFYSDKHLVLAAVLDPRFKTEWIFRDGTVSNRLAEIREMLVKEAEYNSVDKVTEARSVPKKVRIFGSYESNSSVAGTAIGQMEEYLGSLRRSPQEDVLGFWKTSAGSFPQLAKVARKIFSIPSGSSSAERVFSAAGLLSRAHRMSLKPDTLSKLMFLKVNSKIQ
ncbi:uncharacterized protein [Chanodichthys erythropterus]|uniref:uncharacterized protein n=1 Tax=Chanodichthys erythropterus TaxID=933992 RepID=UPI00351EED3E